jgi:hypothetical protein
MHLCEGEGEGEGEGEVEDAGGHWMREPENGARDRAFVCGLLMATAFHAPILDDLLLSTERHSSSSREDIGQCYGDRRSAEGVARLA